MSLHGWMGRLTQQCLPRSSERRRVRPCLEVLEDRLTPSGGVPALPTSPQGLNLGQPSQALTVPSSNSQFSAMLNSVGNSLSSLSSTLASISSAGGKPTLTANGSSLNGAGNSAIQQQISVQLVNDLGNLVTTLDNVLVHEIGPSGTGQAGASSAGFVIPSSGGGTPTLTATQQEIIQGLNSLVFTTSPLTPTASQISQSGTLQLDANNGKAAVAPGDGPILYLASNASHPDSSKMQFVDANSDHYRTA
jgi:hypothetical protein